MFLPLLPHSGMTNPMIHYDCREIHWLPHLHMVETKIVPNIHFILSSRKRDENVEEKVLQDSTQRSEVATPV